MRYRRFVCFLLGAWLGGSLFMTMVAIQNFRSVDRLLSQPAAPAAAQIAKLGPDMARQFLRYQVSEQNRWYFETWDTVQLGLGLVVVFVMVFGTNEGKLTLLTALVLFAIVVVDRFVVTPQVIALGRLLDFRDAMTPERAQFWVLHQAYSGLELVKWGIIVGLAGRLVLWRPRRSGDPGEKIDLVDKADYRHVNR